MTGKNLVAKNEITGKIWQGGMNGRTNAQRR